LDIGSKHEIDTDTSPRRQHPSTVARYAVDQEAMNMRRTTLALLAVATMLAGGLAAQQKTRPDVDLQAAIRTETVDGDLKSAIGQYRKLTTSSDRGVAAQAWLRMGQCYEKLGSAEARQAYERAVRDFPDQTAVVTAAQARLLALSGNRPGVAYRQVWTGPKVDTNGRVSPDGRYLSYVDWDTGDLGLHDLATGGDRRLTNKGDWAKSSEFAEQSAISPDGKQVAYAWYDGKDGYELRVAAIPSSGFVQPRRLFGSQDVGWIAPCDWSPDGRWIAVSLSRKDGVDQTGLVSVQSGSLRVLRSGSDDGHMFFSPDGKFLAVAHNSPGRPARDLDVFLLDVDGSGETTAVAGPARDSVMGWAPDGKQLLFASDRTGSTAVWGVPVSDGKPQGAPVLLRPNVQADSLGVTSTGALYIGLQIDGRDVHVATLDFSTGSLLSPPVLPIESFVGSNAQPDWSPDGKFLAYTSVHSRASGDRVLAIRSVDTGLTRELRPNLQGFNWPRWAPDGRSFACQGTDAQGRQGIYLIDAQTAAVTPVVTRTTGRNLQRPQWSPDGKRIYYATSLPASGEVAIIERNLDSGAERDVIRRQGLVGLELSPDGRHVAVWWVAGSQPSRPSSSTVLLIPTAGGEPREFLRSTATEVFLTNLAWGPGGRSLLVQKNAADGAQLWSIPIDGGERRRLDLSVWNAIGMRVHPDGRQVAYLDGENKFEIMALENFLPSGTAVK
jgi:Tol biopolymer transport system component